MLIVKVHNVSPIGAPQANYDVEVLVTTSPTTLKPIAKGKLKNHTRSNGWRALLTRIAEEVPDYNLA